MAAPTNPNIIDLEDYVESINMVIYAEPGVGKTVLAGTDNVLFLALKNEKGTIAAARQGSKAKVWKINEWNDLEDAYDWLYENPNHGFNWVVIDSVTAMQKQCMRSILDHAVKESKGQRDPDLPQLQDWQKYYNLFDRFIAAFNDLPVHVLYLATEMQNEDPEGEEIVLPNLAGRGSGYSISASLCASVMVVGRMSKDVSGKGASATHKRQILFESLPPYTAKDRYNCLPRYYLVSDGDKQIGSLRDIRLKIESSGRKPRVPAKKTTTIPRRTTRVPAKQGVKKG